MSVSEHVSAVMTKESFRTDALVSPSSFLRLGLAFSVQSDSMNERAVSSGSIYVFFVSVLVVLVFRCSPSVL
jgi:hypothetical protein